MPKHKKSHKQKLERLRLLSQLISDGKLSKEKLIEVQTEYCFLQREIEHLTIRER